MTDISHAPHTAPAPRSALSLKRIFFAIPVIGWIARDVTEGDQSNIYFALLTFVSLWIMSGMTFGLPGLYLPAVALVPVMFGLLIAITQAKLDPADARRH